jgi:hypothetical protein
VWFKLFSMHLRQVLLFSAEVVCSMSVPNLSVDQLTGKFKSETINQFLYGT